MTDKQKDCYQCIEFGKDPDCHCQKPDLDESFKRLPREMVFISGVALGLLISGIITIVV